jgi:hypothetical protein
MKVDHVGFRMQVFALGVGGFPQYIRQRQTALWAWVVNVWTLSLRPDVAVAGSVRDSAPSSEDQRHQDDVCNRAI